MVPEHTTPYSELGGAERIRRLVHRFYALMDTLPEAWDVRQMHPEDLSGSEEKLFKYLSGWLGGPQHYVERFGHPRLRMRHGRVPVDIAMRDAWLRAMTTALDEQAVTGTLRGYLDARFAEVADFLRNTPG